MKRDFAFVVRTFLFGPSIILGIILFTYCVLLLKDFTVPLFVSLYLCVYRNSVTLEMPMMQDIA